MENGRCERGNVKWEMEDVKCPAKRDQPLAEKMENGN